MASRLDNFIRKFGEDEGRKRYDEYRKKISRSEKSCIQLYGEEEGRKRYAEICANQGQSLEKFIKLYGEDEGTKRYNEWKDNCKLTLDKFIERYGEEEGTKKYNEVRKTKTKEYQKTKCTDEEWSNKHALKKNSLDNFIIRHGEIEGKQKYDSYVETNKRPRIQKFIDTYGYEEGTAKYKEWNKSCHLSKDEYTERFGEERSKIMSKNKVLSKEKFIKLYGEEEGVKRYCHWINELSKKRQAKGYSKESVIVLNVLNALGIKNDYIKCKFTSSDEYFIIGDEHTCFYDFFLPAYNLIIDYHGEIYHPQVERYDINTARNIFESNKARKNKFDAQLNKDIYRKELAVKSNFNYLVIWSYESYDEIKNKIIQYVSYDPELYLNENSKTLNF